MCPSADEVAASGVNGQANGVNGHANGVNGNGGRSAAGSSVLYNADPSVVEHPGYTGIDTKTTPYQSRNPYMPVGDFLSNVSRFKIIESTLREGEQYVDTLWPELFQ